MYESNGSELRAFAEIYFFDTKKHVVKCILDIESIENSIEHINKSKLVAFGVKDINRNLLINKLSNLAAIHKHYSPIVEVGENTVFLFPQLNYGDMLLLMSLFKQKYTVEKINVILGAEAIIE